uniref:Hyp8 n=1 Tax=Moniliophthora roreri (strain MCA 2997) TaxID=1381753 RepID=F2WVJ9_MONRO|nr:hyp8 [Moniliophthora roreri]ADO51591.1 hyp8 [Moniliophthora roreri]
MLFPTLTPILSLTSDLYNSHNLINLDFFSVSINSNLLLIIVYLFLLIFLINVFSFILVSKYSKINSLPRNNLHLVEALLII